ncbi:MAG: tRNA (adenosine(37)-N6)-threonylcarbamoyltransferase complex ATPase subunit type 1 TsaE [Bacteroidaceae bacterium]|nr:tRNA (adenosine(37)-N6)-threonylcarbamoyltransferase complex ATPase subunit type 1 TsaE [Bacteroidaceae bacterium]MBO4593234.1 tRNA (adenosine(37)-N6)-threonylcarbamoyltransferase complex ATPase subunit type 1 TsaE [Bacteroidaceae bacterium]
MLNNIKILTLEDLDKAAAEFLPLMEKHRIFAFYGGMGAGKTTFICALCRQLGVIDATGSPSFAIVNEYRPENGMDTEPNDNSPISNFQSIYHFDFYRIKNLAEVYDIGYEDYFYSGQPCFIEWPELIEPLLPEETVRVHFTVNDDLSRVLEIDAPEG